MKAKDVAISGGRIGAMFMVFYLLYLGALFSYQRNVLFPAWGEFEGVERSQIENGEWWTTPTEDGPVEALFIKAKGASKDNPRPAVVFVHGNGNIVDNFVHRADWYRAQGYHVLFPEYRGYGRSAGEPSEEGIVADSLEFLKRLKARDDVDTNAIIYHGHSLGGGIVAGMAASQKPKALILESTFTTIKAFAPTLLAPSFLVRDPFDTETVLKTLNVPVLVIHGTQDGVVPLFHAKANIEAAKNVKSLIIEDEAHVVSQSQEYWTAIEALIGN